MFDEKNHDRADALGERLQRLGGKINPSPELKKAAKTGVPLRATGIRYTAGTHIRKFSKAVLLYAACVAILLCGVFLLPRLFGEGGPVATSPSQTTTTAPTPECEHKYIATISGMQTCTQSQITTCRCERCGHSYSKTKAALGHNFVDGICTRCGEEEGMLSPETVWGMVLSESNVTVSYKMTYHFDDGTSLDATALLMRDGNYYYKKIVSNVSESASESMEESYCDAVEFVEYLYDAENGVWIRQNIVDVYLYWENVCNEYIPEEFFHNAYYELVDGVYTVTDKGLDLYFGDVEIAKDYYAKIVWDFSQQNGVYTARRLIRDGDGTVHTEILLDISFGTASITLPDEDVPPPPADCEHGQDPATCPYCNCDGHEFADNTCTKCGLVCEHEYSDVSGGICILCGTECYHVYNEGTCNVVCTLCGKRQGHHYEEIISTDHICTEGTITTTACSRCGYSYKAITPAKGHSYDSKDVCTVCGEAKKVITVTDPDVTAGSVSLLPGQMVQTYPSLTGDGFTWVDPTMTPYYYNVYTYFGGYTVTDIRVPVYHAEKGSVLTIGVARVENGFVTDRIAFYELTADRDMSEEWVLFSGLSIEVPEGCTLTFGWMSDTLWYASPVSGHIPGYSQQDDYSDLGSQIPLIFDVYGKKN